MSIASVQQGVAEKFQNRTTGLLKVVINEQDQYIGKGDRNGDSTGANGLHKLWGAWAETVLAFT
jgi:hypothetical protein